MQTHFKLTLAKNIFSFTKMISKISCVSNLSLILFIFPFQTYFILSSPVPEFEFPKSGISFSSSDENDEYKDISRCLNEEDYSMPYFDPKTRQVYLKSYTYSEFTFKIFEIWGCPFTQKYL